MTPTNINMTPTNINFTLQKYAGAVGLDRCTEVRRTPNIQLRFVGFIRFVSFNFSHVQLLRFVVVMVWSYSFGHLDSFK